MSSQINLRELSEEEFDNQYLPLRHLAFAQERHWSKKSNAAAMRDEYDCDSIHYGIVSDRLVIGAIRVVLKMKTTELPSGKFLPESELAECRCAELGRAVVEPHFRGGHLFPLLSLHATIEAIEHGASHLYVSMVDRRGNRHFGLSQGYQVIGSPHPYHDSLLDLSENTITMKLHFNAKSDVSELVERRMNLLAIVDRWVGAINAKG